MIKRFLYKSYRLFYYYEKWQRRRPTIAGLTVAVMVVIAGLLGLDTHQSKIYQVFTLLLSVLVIAFIWSKTRLRINIRAHRKLPKYATVGEKFVYKVEFENFSGKKQVGLKFYENGSDPRPTFDELVNAKEPGEEQRNVWDRKILYYRWLWLISQKRKIDDALHAIPDLPANGKTETQVQVVPRNRGILHLMGMDIARPDPLGLFQTLATIAAPQKVTILPRRYQLPQIHLPGATRYHKGGVSHASSIGNFEEFVSLRDYRPGDSMRQIHWKSTAKKNALIIKEYQEEFFVRHALILDTFFNLVYSDIFEEAVSVAASFVCSWQTRESLLDLLFVGDRAYRFSSGRGMASFESMLEVLAAVGVCTDKSFDSIGPLVFEQAHLCSGCICILLAWDEVRKAFIQQLLNRGIPLLVIVIVEDGPSIPIDPGPMNRFQKRLLVLKTGHIQEGLVG